MAMEAEEKVQGEENEFVMNYGSSKRKEQHI